MPDKKYTRIEEEVMEILDRIEDERPAPPRAHPHLRLVSSRPMKRKRRITMPNLRLTSLPIWWSLAAAFALALAALVVRDTSQTLGLILAVISALVFLSPFVFRRPTGGTSDSGFGGPVTKEWRGRDITLGPSPGPSSSERVKRWIDSRRGRIR
jgi:hypothetical protein